MFLLLAALLSFSTHDLSRWHEVTPPNAPFTLDVPLGLEDGGVRDVSGAKVHSWRRKFGFMTIEIEHTDRERPTSLTVRQTVDMLATGLLREWPGATMKVTDVTIAGQPAAQLDIERTTEKGNLIRSRIVRVRVADGDDWKIQTTHAGDTEKADVAHFWSAIQPVQAPPVLTPVTIGRLSMVAPGKPKATVEQLQGENAQTLDKWTTHAFADQRMTVWVYHLQFAPGQQMDDQSSIQRIVDDVIAQSNPKPRFFISRQTIGAASGLMTNGQATTAEGDEAIRIFVIKDGRDGWAMLAAGPNSARTEGMLRDMVKSVVVRP